MSINRTLTPFAALAVLSLLLMGCSGDEEPQYKVRSGEKVEVPTMPEIPEEVEVDPAGFTEATEDFGLSFQHNSGADGRKFMPETMTPGVALFDRDQDGDLDMFITNSHGWEGKGEPTTGRMFDMVDGRFVDVTEKVGLAGPEFSMIGQGVCAADYDGDGDLDLFLTALGPNHLLENRDGRFVDVTAQSGLAMGTWQDAEGREHPIWSSSASFADFDGDGWLDLFVASYLEWSIENDVEFVLSGEIKGYANPALYAGSSCRLYRNQGDGTFQDVTKVSGIESEDHKALGVCVIDINGDQRLDILVANDSQPNCLFVNKGDMVFEDMGRDTGMGFGANGAVRAGMGIDAAHYSGENQLAIAIGNFSAEPVSFFRSIGTKSLLFSDDNMMTGLGRTTGPSLTFSTVFFDANLDGYDDLLAINGHIEPDIALLSSSTSWRQRPQLFLNLGSTGRFRDASEASGPVFAREIVGRGLALGDLDKDGDLDAVVTECNGPARIWRNENPAGRKSLRLDLKAPGPNHLAIGATVRVIGGPFPQTDWVRSASGYLSQNETTLTFGLGSAEKATVEVTWPDGQKTSHADLAVGKTHILKHPALGQ